MPLVLCLPGAASAAPAPDVGVPMEAPLGFSQMCVRDPALCTAFAPPAVREAPIVSMVLPIAAMRFRLPLFTAPAAVSTKPADATRDLRALRRINAQVNRSVSQQSDADVYGESELWTRSGMGPGARGDCEDIAIEKRLRLIDAGIAADRLSFAVVYSRRAGLHVLLLARTAGGVVALDSRGDRIRPIEKARYRWITVQDWNEPSLWRQPTIAGGIGKTA